MSATEVQGMFRVERTGEAGASAATAGAPSALRWPLFLSAIVLALAVYWSTAWSLPQRWGSDPTYSHGYLVALVSAWLTWRAWRRGELEGTAPSRFGLLPLALAGLAWLLARGASILVVQQLALPALMLGAAWALFGWRGFKALFVPIGLLFLAVPAWEYLRLPLQQISTFAVGNILQAIGIPVFLHGHRVDLPGGSFEIAEGCSGLNVFMAGAALATIQAYVFLGDNRSRLLLIGVALAATIFANWLRITIIIIAGHLTDMQHWLIDDHYQFGWVTFAIMMIPVLFFGRWLEHRAPPKESAQMRPLWSFELPESHRVLTVAALCLVVLPGVAWWGVSRAGTVAPPPVLPTAVDGWQLDGPAALDWRPLQPGHTTELNGRYTDGAREVDLWLVHYDRQETGRKLIGYGNAMARPGDGRLVPSDSEAGELRLMTGGRHDRLLRYRFEVNGRVSASPLRAKLDEVAGNFTGRPSAHGAFFSARCLQPDCADAREVLEAFETAMTGQVPAMGLE
jgi:exosortase A